MIAACLAALVAAAPARAAEDPAECPAGTHRVSTDNPYEPFRCVGDAAEKNAGFGSTGFATGPRCPRGTHPVAAVGRALQPYRCERTASAAADPELTPLRGDGGAPEPEAPDAVPDALQKGCPPGERKTRTSDPQRPYQCAPLARRAPLDARAYERFSIPRQISFDYHPAFRVQDAWREEVPTLYLKIDDAAAGKPVTITVTRYDESQAAYEEMGTAIARDVEWQGAKDAGTQKVGEARARVTAIAGDTRSVYLSVSKESYYSFVYSAPADSYETYLPAFSRLLASVKLAEAAR